MKTININAAPRRVLLIAIVIVLAIAHWFIGVWGFGNIVSTRADRPEIADFAVDLAPGDPQTHYAAAVLYDRTLVTADQQRSLSEYEKAVTLSPNNYLLWLEYGKALERSGDPSRAESSLKHALELAPNYAAAHWALGNLEVRKGETDTGFEQIRAAVEGNPEYAGSAASFAYQYFDGDLGQVRNVVGTSPRANAALAVLLAKQKRFDEAATVWQVIDQPAKDDSITAVGRSLVNELISAKKFARAMNVDSTLDPGSASAAEMVRDGGFEDAIKLEGASPFDWLIEQGAQPQVLQSTSQPHSGSRSLVLRYTSNDGNGLRAISQTVIVRTNTRYTLGGFYHSDLKADGKLVWQISDAASGTIISELPLAIATSWTPFSVNFQAPADSDGVVLRLTVKACGAALCPVSGSVWLDDIELRSN